jgi:hypothetical protein
MRPFIPAQPDIIEQGVREMVHPFRSTSQLTTPTIVRFSPRLLLGAATIGLGALLFTFGAGTAQADTSGLTSHTNAPTSSSPVGGIAGALDGTVKTVAGALHGTTKTLAADLNGTTKTIAADLNGTTKTVAGGLHDSTKTAAGALNGTTKTLAADLNGTLKTIGGLFGRR